MKYAEQPLDVEGYIALLARRGLQFGDRERARRILRHTDTHLLWGYWPLLAEPGTGGRRFRNGTSFEDAMELYDFDSSLRILLMAAIQTLEISLRTQWARHPSLAYGPLFYRDPKHFKEDFRGRSGRKWSHRDAYALLHRMYTEERKPQIKYFVQQYGHPPAWVVAGVMSLRQLTRWYGALQERAMREKIARTYGISETLLVGFLPSLATIRNTCAHHGQLYGRLILAYPRAPRKPAALRESYGKRNDGRIYNILVFIAYLLGQIEERQREEFARGLQRLFGQHRGITPARLGFPARWWQLSVWRL